MAEPVPQNNPGEPQPLPTSTSPVDFIEAQRQRGAMLAMSASEADPDEASRAYDLSKTTGVNPALIHTDTEAFNNKVKSAITSKLVLNDDFLAEYARSHALAASISNDDWGQLSKISALINPWRGQSSPMDAQRQARQQEFNPGGELGLSLTKPLIAGLKASSDVYADSQIVKWTPTPPPPTDSVAGRLAWSVASSGNLAGDLAGDLVRYLMVGGSQAISGLAAVGGEVGKEVGVSSAPKTAQDVSEALQDPGFYESIPPIEGVPVGQAIGSIMRGLHERFIGPVAEAHAKVLDKSGADVAQSLNAAQPYLEQGRMPPVGIDPQIDGYYKELAKKDADWLKEVDKEIGASSTYARNPEFFAKEFVNLRHPPDMSVSFEGVKKLYGDDGVPEPGDNKLGNVYRAAEQFDHAKDFQGDLDISAADWVRLKPEVRDELRDFVRLRRGGMTAEEAKGPLATAEAPKVEGEEVKSIPTPLDTVSRAAKLDTTLPTKGGSGYIIAPPKFYSGEPIKVGDVSAKSTATFPLRESINALPSGERLGWLGDAPAKILGDKFIKEVGDTPVHVVSDQDMTALSKANGWDFQAAGYYDPNAGHIVISDKIASGRAGPNEAIRTILHESSHVFMQDTIEKYPKLAALIEKIMTGAEGALKDNTNAKYFKGLKYFDNIHEFIAGAHSDPHFWDALHETKLPEDLRNSLALSHDTKTFWDAFRDIFKQLWNSAFGTKLDDTYLDAVMRVSDITERLRGEMEQGPTGGLRATEEASAANNLKEWFSKSKMVDKEGNPQVFYHGSGRSFDEFKTQNTAGKFGGAYFTKSTGLASSYAQTRTKIGESGQVYPVYLKIENPKIMDDPGLWGKLKTQFSKIKGEPTSSSALTTEDINNLKSRGYDGIVNKTLNEVVVFDPTQVKSAVGNRGTFSSTDPRISATREVPPEDRPAFKTPGTIGMSPKRMENYNKLLEKENQEKIDFSKKLAEKSEREQQTTEWKENYDKVKDEVRAEFIQRPDVAAERLLRDGMAPDGSKLRNHKLDADALTAEQKKALPPEFYGKNGVAPDDLAPAFGFASGDELVASLARTKAQQDLEGLTPAASFNQRLKAETERAMRQRYGDLETNVLEMAKDQVFSPTTLDRLSEEVLALAEAGGKEITLDRATLQKLARDKFNNIPIGNHSSDKYIAAAGRAGQVAEDALLEGKIAEAFKAKQEQYLSMLYGAEANKLEKVKSQFDKRVPKWQRREPPGIEQADAVWMHQILEQIGLGKRSLQDLDRSKELVSPYKSLRGYAEGVNGQNELYNTDVNAMPVAQKVAISDFLFTDNYRNEVDKMLPDEFRQVFDSLKSIDHYSRNEKKYTVKGAKEDLEEVVNGLVERLKAAVDNKPISESLQQKKSAGRVIGTWLLNPETWANRLDLGDRFGPFNQLIIRPITEGQYTLRVLEREFASKWGDVAKSYTDLRKKISNPLFKETDGSPIQMTKANAYAVLQNMGNTAQRAKLVKGWGIDEDVNIGTQKIWNWLRQVGIGPDDLARAQKLGGVFNDAFKHSETTYTQINGVAPARIDLNTMQTPWGEAKEWYHPLIPDPLRHKVDLSIDQMMGESGYYRPSPAAGYAKTRTGATYPIDLTFDSVPFKLKQILNDAAMRQQITEVSKIVYNKSFQGAFKRYYGAEYASALDAWMKDVAGNRSWVPQNMAALDKATNGLAQNLNTALIGLNLGTVMKHAPTAAAFSIAEVGPINFARSMAKMIYELPGSRESWNFAMAQSEELQNRMRHVEDTLIAQNQETFKKVGWKGTASTIHDLASWYGHYPVGITDLISAVAMWDAEYKRLAEAHPDLEHGDLVYGANTAVRRTHGSSILSNRPALMRAGGLWKLVTPFYNFFNNALQRNYELAWKSKLAIQGLEVPEMVGFDSAEFKAGPAHIPRIIGGLIVFGVIPSLIEQMVDPLPQQPGEGNAKHWAKVLTQAYPSMIPGVRDIVNGLERNRDPSLGLFGTAMRDVAEPLRTASWTKSPGQAFQTANRAIGMATGLTMEPVGKAGRFMINVMHGDEHPQGIGDWAKGLYKGTMKEQRR